MKKLMSIFGAALFVFALASCGPETTEEAPEGNGTEEGADKGADKGADGGDGGE